MRLVRAGDAAPGDHQALGAARHQAAQWNVVRLARRQALQHGAGAGRIVDVDRIRAARDRVVELARREDIVDGELIVTEHAPRLAHADLHAALRDVRLLEARHVAPQEFRDLAHLLAARPLGEAPIPYLRAHHARHPGTLD